MSSAKTRNKLPFHLSDEAVIQQLGWLELKDSASLANYYQFPITFIVPVGVVASLAAIWFLNRNAHPVKAFLSSCLYLFFMLAGACWGLYPTLLPATTGADRDITLSHAISGPHTLAVGLVWWGFGMALAVAYVVFVYSKFRGKVILDTGGH
jgi:cytochrome d ubiquinol oxidase subunit II